MAAFYEDNSYSTLEGALAARAADASPAGTITIVGDTAVSASGSLTIDQPVAITSDTPNNLSGVLTVTASGVSFNAITFTSQTANAEILTILSNNVSITESAFDGGTTASRAFVASGQGLAFTNNSITGFVNGSYVNPSATGAITGNTISDSGNGFVVDSTGLDISGNTFSNIARSNISITAASSTVNLSDFFDSGNIFDGTGTQIATTRLNSATTVNGTSENDRLINADDAFSAFTFNGFGGNDTVDSGQGNDTINGGAGTGDVVVFAGARSEYTVTQNSNGSYTVTDSIANRNGTDSLVRVEIARFANGDVQLTTTDNTPPPSGGGGGTPTPQPPVTEGTAGNDNIAVGFSTMPVYGGAGSDSITATPAAGTTAQLFGGSATNDPNDGGDTISVSGAGSVVAYGNGGNDQITVTATGASSVFGGMGDDRVSVTNNADNSVVGGMGADTIAITGNGNNQVLGGSSANDPNDGADRITISGNGNNTVYANGGNDTIVITGSGSNTVYGGAGNDAITGGSGNDQIVGGQGSNVLTGGAGSDKFVFTSGGQDIITDFNFAEGDRIALNGKPYGFTQTSDGNAAILIGESGVIVLAGVSPESLSADFFA